MYETPATGPDAVMMTPMKRIITVPGCAMLVGLCGVPASAEDPSTPVNGGVPKVTSHSLEYCNKLGNQIDALVIGAPVAPPSDVIELSTEGKRMCEQGHMRGGIMRLRKALMMMQDVVNSQ